MLQSMGLQKVRHDLVTEQQQQKLLLKWYVMITWFKTNAYLSLQ